MSNRDESKAAGGVARALALSPERKREIAAKAAAARWGKVPTATHKGVLPVAGIELPCFVLDDGTRVISGRGVTRAIGMKGRGQGVSRIVNHKRLSVFMDGDLVHAIEKPLVFNSGAPLPTQGYPANVLVQLCEAVLKARDAGALTTEQEQRYARSCDVLVRAFAHVGIVALVDEATGYQADRARDALARILETFIAKELRPWVKTFQTDFYRELLRLRGLEFDGTLKQPRYIGKLTNDLVYRRLAPGVLEELRRINPANERGQRKHKHFQWLTQQIGYQKLVQHLAAVTTLMKVFDDYDSFKVALDRALPAQVALPLFDEPVATSKPLPPSLG